eukprot:TRINITY_DN19531_c0_g1_i1.p1 TRINITY_DN19531_c0_g1~~TRINITY_DN19531_c0_g1_i1.p1  ORF type:complete len:732 (-),score=207.50 TRINITY_DN19531_c0_g1_i1:158-2353(-)
MAPAAQDDFYKCVNDSWLSDPEVVIPPEYPRWGSFIKLVDEALKTQISMLQELVSKAESHDEKLLGVAWGASMKRFADWKEGKGEYTDILKELQVLGEHIPSTDDEVADYTVNLAKYLSRCNELDIGCPLVFDKEANLQDSENVVLDLGGSGLSLPSRDYYLDSKFEEQRGWFRAHLAKVIELVGSDNVEADFVDRVMRIETKLAQITMKSDQKRQYDQYFTVSSLDGLLTDVNSLNHLKDKDANYADNVVDSGDKDKEVLSLADYPVSAEDTALMKTFWEQLFASMSLREVMKENYKKNYPDGDAEKAQYRMMVFDGDYFRRVLRLLLRSHNRKDVKAYLQYKVIKSAKSFATKALDEEFFDFYNRKLSGQKEQKSDEKRTVALLNAWMGELIGKIYVSKYFKEEDKNAVRDMVKDVLAIMESSLKTNDWLTETTKQKAMEKLSKFVVKLGYPDKWKDFSKLNITAEDSLFIINQKVSAFDRQKEFKEKINSVKDKSKWEMNPQDVNAYFHPLNNEIVFPAAIMQVPFYQASIDSLDFDPGCPKDTPSLLTAVNFGGIGAVIAHEITHGYDDQGRKFDSAGNIQDWWQPADAELFKGKCDLMKEQAGTWKFVNTPEDGGESKTHEMNAELTMGENLADLGGLSLAYQGLQRRLGDKLTKEHTVAFFRSWANVWKSKETNAFIIQALATDPHAPCDFRANLAKNIDAFHEVFETKPGQGMYLAPEKRVQMW